MCIDGVGTEVDKWRQVAIEAWAKERGWRTWGQSKEAEDGLEDDVAEDDGEDDTESEEENGNVEDDTT